MYRCLHIISCISSMTGLQHFDHDSERSLVRVYDEVAAAYMNVGQDFGNVERVLDRVKNSGETDAWTKHQLSGTMSNFAKKPRKALHDRKPQYRRQTSSFAIQFMSCRTIHLSGLHALGNSSFVPMRSISADVAHRIGLNDTTNNTFSSSEPRTISEKAVLSKSCSWNGPVTNRIGLDVYGIHNSRLHFGAVRSRRTEYLCPGSSTFYN